MQPATKDDYEEAASLEEGVPLLPSSSRRSSLRASQLPKLDEPTKDVESPGRLRQAADSVASSVIAATKQNPVFNTSHNDKMLCYDHDTLLTPRAVLYIGRSVFCQKPVIYTLISCSLMATLAAACVYFIPKASKLDTSKFDAFGNFLKFFIVFMLGIYVQQGFKRWWVTVTTFEKFLIGCRQLLFMLHTIKATPAFILAVEDYCIASAYLLNVEVRNTSIVDKDQHVPHEDMYAWLVDQGFILQDEATQLGKSQASILGNTRAIWSWIGELVAHPEVAEGVTVLPPLLVRGIAQCQLCITEIEHLKMNITMQTPFVYSQLLAILVHLNNTILSISCGMALGSSLNEIRRRGEQLSNERDTHHRDVTIIGQFYEAFQTIGMQIVIVLLAPMLYVAFLHIAHILCYPFGDESYHLPTETLIARLHSELNHMSDNRAYFRQQHAELLDKKREKIGKDKKGLKDDDEDDDDAGDDDGGDCD